MAKVKKAQKGTMSAKDSMNMYARKVDSLSAEAVNKMSKGKSPSKDIKAMKEARAKESGIAKRLYGTTPGPLKKGGAMKKKMMKDGGTLAPTKKSVGKTIGKLNKAKYGSKMSTKMSKKK